MKIAYFSPLDPRTSSIADYSEELLPHLARHAEIDLFVDGYVPSNPDVVRSFAVYDYLAFEKMWWQGSYDVALYHMGNDPCHEYIYRTLQQYPGVTVLHDLNIHHFIVEITVGRGDGDEYLAEMVYSHGEQGAEDARRALITSRAFPAWDYPLNRRVIDSSLGLIVHNQFCYDGVRAVNAHVPLAKIAHAMQMRPGGPGAKAALGLDPDSFVVASFGLVTPAKRVDVALRAFKDLLPHAGNAVFLVVGRVAEGCDITALIDELGIGARVKITGHVDKEALQQYLDTCDVCVNLRFPTCGETSGIALRAMAAGKPLIVSEVGSFAEIPDDCCIKVPVDSQEVASVAAALRRLANDGEARRQMGARARDRISQHHDPERIAQAYVSFIEGVLGDSSRSPTACAAGQLSFEDAASRDDEAQLDSAVNTVEAVKRIRERIRSSRLAHSTAEGIGWDGNLAEVASLRRMLEHHLRQADLVCGDVFVEDQMRQSKTLPGLLATRVRKPLHSLVRFYLDRLAARQAGFNYFLTKALTALAQEAASQEEDIQAGTEELRSSVRSLRERADRLEATLAGLLEKSGL